MANRYWVGGAGNWDASNTTNWSDTSGGVGGFSIPTSADDVFFNSASSAIAYAVGITATANCNSLTISGPATGNLTLSGTSALNVYGSLILPSSGFVNSYTGLLTFRSTAVGNTITTNSVTFQGAVTFNGIGGAWQFQDNFRVVNGKTLTFTNATIDLNNFVVSGDILAFASLGIAGLTVGTGWFEATGASGTVINGLPGLALPTPVSGIPTVKVTASTASTRTIRTTQFNGTFWDVFITAGTGQLRTFAGGQSFRNLTFTGFTGELFILGYIVIVNNLTFGAGMTTALPTVASNVIVFNQFADDSVPYDVTKYITTNNVVSNYAIWFDYADNSTSWVLIGNLTINVPSAVSVGQDLYITSYGTPADVSFNANGYDVTTSNFYLEGNVSYPIYANFTLNGGVLTITNSGYVVDRAGTNTVNFVDQSSSEIVFTYTGSKSFIDTESTVSYGQITNSSSGTLSITTNEILIVSNSVSPSSFEFNKVFATPLIVSIFNISGSAGNLVSITGKISKTSGVVSSNYLSITSSDASGGATWYAGANSVNGGTNSGWLFQAAPSSSAGFFFL